MTPPRMTEADVGAYYQDEGGELWRLVSYSDQPTATLERVNGLLLRPERRGGVVGAPIFEGFRRLIPEEPR